MSNLQIRKIYFDSRFKTANSESNSKCTFELKESVNLPRECYGFIDDICIPFSWTTIDSHNENLYFRQINSAMVSTDTIITLARQSYTGISIAAAIKSVLDSAYGNNSYSVVYGDRTGRITFTCNTANTTFVIFTDDSLKTGALGFSVPYDNDNPKSFNDLLRNTGISTDSSTFTSGFIDLQSVHNIYISSPNLGSHDTIGC